MKVFSLLSLGRNLENFKKQGEADLHHLYGYNAPQACSIRVWGVVYLLQGLPEPLPR